MRYAGRAELRSAGLSSTLAHRFAVVAAIALVAVGAAPASAAEPMPCRGISFTDPADAPANRDIREGWFSYSGGRPTANLRLARVDEQFDMGDGSATYAMYYTVRRTSRFVSARFGDGAWSYAYGDDGGGVRGTTTGSVRLGPGGVIEIEVPQVHAVQGDTLLSVHARSFTGDALGLLGTQEAGAPEGQAGQFGYGANFLVERCPAPPSDAQAQPAPLATPDRPTAAPPAAPAAPGAAPRRAAFTVTVPRLRARSLTRGRSFRVRVDPAAPVEALAVTLRTKGRVFARGRRASLTLASRVKVKVGRRIVRGTYRLTLSGRTPAGRRVSGAVTVRVT